MMSHSVLDKLTLADPELAAGIRAAADSDPSDWPISRQIELVEETLWALTQGQALGDVYAAGLLRLIPRATNDQVHSYFEAVHGAASNGLTLALIIAEHFLPVLLWGTNKLSDKFQGAVATMLQKGTYTLKPPLEGLSWLLKNRQLKAADAYLDLLDLAFSKEISYNLSLKFSYLLPKSIRSFEFSKNHFQIVQLGRVLDTDFVLAERFLTGLENGLKILDEAALDQFVCFGLKKYRDNVAMGRKFLGLSSRMALSILEDLRVSVSLTRIRPFLERTIRVRIGHSVPIRPVSEAKAWIDSDEAAPCYVCSDGKHIYMVDEISDFRRKDANEMLYKLLAKLESAAVEFGSFDFDLNRLDDIRCANLKVERTPGLTDYELFYRRFDIPELARDLFNIFEQGRLRHRLNHKYAGLARTAFSFLRGRIESCREGESRHFLQPLYEAVALGIELPADDFFTSIARQSNRELEQEVSVEISALWVLHCYNQTANFYFASGRLNAVEYVAFAPLYGRRIQPALLQRTWAEHDRSARRIRKKLSAGGVNVYLADIRRQLVHRNGTFTGEDLNRIILTAQKNGPLSNDCRTQSVDIASLDLNAVMDSSSNVAVKLEEAGGRVRRHKEWDCRVSDYIQNHVRVVDQTLSGTDEDFYSRTLSERAGLVKRMRKAFELLKPEGLVLLRQWIEGDEFDYRALLDFALDKRAGIMPSDRLYIKRVKQHREVAVLLLVDVSRSTANCVAETNIPVLSVQKEAIVLFCEALSVVGDDFAIAGFSGSGRLNVDYFRFKDFNEPLREEVKQRIGTIAPQRSTRMGAAIRHGISDLEQSDRKVRLMLILSDGFPNDADYKGEYAVADTRTAILEARSKNIVVKAITVNMGADLRLNDLYGSAHHHVIEDVRDLPGQLLRMYGNLTRI